MRIRAISLSFQDTIYHEKLKQTLPNGKKLSSLDPGKDVIAYNKTFLDRLKEQNKDFDKVVVLLGSEDQSLVNLISSGIRRHFPLTDLQRITEFLNTGVNKVALDTFLLADAFGGQKVREFTDLDAGVSYAQAIPIINKLKDNGFTFIKGVIDYKQYAATPPDCSKLLILYAQLHKLASENPNAQISYDFFEGDDSIVHKLATFFTQYPFMIPKNVTLNINKYAGEEIIAEKAIQGRGPIDDKYRETIRKMFNLVTANYSYPLSVPENYISRLTPSFGEESGLTFTCDYSEKLSTPLFKSQKTQPAPDNHFSVINNLLEDILTKSSDLQTRGHTKASEEAEKLYFTIKEALKEYSNPDDATQYSKFKDKCDHAIQTAHKELDKHRGWKQILANLAIGVLTIGFAFLYHKVNTGKFFFFEKTDSTKLIDVLEKNIDKLKPNT